AKVQGIEGLTKIGATLGSPVYSSPEQLLGKETDARADVYALGITFYEMVVGSPPLKLSGESDYEAIKKTLEFTPKKPSTANPAVPPSVDALVLKSIAKDPDKRFQSVSEFEQAVKQLLATMSPIPAYTPVPGEPQQKIGPAKKDKMPPGQTPPAKGQLLDFNRSPHKKFIVLALSL
ncbi:MAG: protein kinase, partial [bacterium]|nr:protein kinase [bacterium]